MSMSLRVIVPPHPLISHWLTILRNPTTPEILYATGLEQLGTWLTYEALRDWIPSKKEQVPTSSGTAECSIIDPKKPMELTIFLTLRALRPLLIILSAR